VTVVVRVCRAVGVDVQVGVFGGRFVHPRRFGLRRRPRLRQRRSIATGCRNSQPRRSSSGVSSVVHG
jgi:hypothetical protein